MLIWLVALQALATVALKNLIVFIPSDRFRRHLVLACRTRVPDLDSIGTQVRFLVGLKAEHLDYDLDLNIAALSQICIACFI